MTAAALLSARSTMLRMVPLSRRKRRGRNRSLGASLGLAVISALFLAGCSTGNFQPVRPIAVDAGRTAGVISSYRAQHGLGPVSVDSRLMQAAADYARAMGERDKINHRIGGTLAKRVSAAGYDWGATAENLGGRLFVARRDDGRWKNSGRSSEKSAQPAGD